MRIPKERNPLWQHYRKRQQHQKNLSGRVFTWLLGIVSISILLYMMVAIVHQITVPPTPQRLTIVQDIPLPGALAPANNQDLTPGTETIFDGFDFQVYDAPTHRLFINHTGPAPDDLILNHVPFDPKADGHIVVLTRSWTK